MKIVMVTNTFTPHVSGVARSVEAFTAEYRRLGHEVLVIAPQFDGTPTDEPDVVRVPAIQNFNGSDFSLRLPVPGFFSDILERFQPDIVHSHHPFLLGGTALRIAASWDIPLVFTHHTMYEQYTHYIPGDSRAMKRFVVDLASGYANLCDQVFAPSESVASILRERGVEMPIEVVPTGVDVNRFAEGDGAGFRRRRGIPADTFVVGFVGRLAPEKNLEFLSRSVIRFLQDDAAAHFLVVGSGGMDEPIRRLFAESNHSNRLHLTGVLEGRDLADAYHAMDVFAFASRSETQGMVLTEAMAAGVPVVAIDAPGVREIIINGRNGRLLHGQHVLRFVEALKWVRKRSPAQWNALRREALLTAECFSMSRCAARALKTYEMLIGLGPRKKTIEDSFWEASLRRLEAEWDLWSNRVHAAGEALRRETHPGRIPVLRQAIFLWRALRRFISRRERSVRLLGLPKSVGTGNEEGLVLLQIDGLSRKQLERALHRRRMPFLRKLLSREGYRLHPLYSGLPSTTPAVQGELFYGIRTVVPAFSFRDHRTGEIVRMFEPDVAARIQRELATQGPGLLEGGSAYSNIYSGNATESHFCAVSLGWPELLDLHPLRRIALALLNLPSIVRTVFLLGLEFLTAVGDCVRGLIAGRDLWLELKFIPRRIAVSILLRELITIGAEVDVTRGLPIVQANFLGFDEQAHHRGPDSAFAHWSLRGIDRAIRRIWNAAHRSPRRTYHVWIYSDHGQESSVPYATLTGETIHEAVARIFHTLSPSEKMKPAGHARGIESQRSRWLGGRFLQKLLPGLESGEAATEVRPPIVTAMGPMGLIYCERDLSFDEQTDLARRLVAEAHIPLVFTVDAEQTVWGYDPTGRFRLPEELDRILEPNEHVDRDQLARDLMAICRHRDAGEFVICGWRANEPVVSFVNEQGAHGGPGSEETGAFALLPPDAPLPETPHLRPWDLRQMALKVLERLPGPADEADRRLHRPLRKPRRFRVMTYNVHSCLGLDGKLSPARIARVIAQYQPDIVALQELDVGRIRSGSIDQAHEIARLLEMEFHFHPAMQVGEELYGNAVLSRFPLRVVHAGKLPGGVRDREPRGAQWLVINVDGRDVHFFNTHLGLAKQERLQQVDALLGSEWLSHPTRKGPVICCGDFNARPASRVHRRMLRHLRDTQLEANGHPLRNTWVSVWPLLRIDYVFIDDRISVRGIKVPRTSLARVASDHLPLIVDLELD